MEHEEDTNYGVGHNGGPSMKDPMIEQLEALTVSDLLTKLQKKLLVDLVAKLEQGQAGHQEYAVIAKILKDNGLVFAPKDDEEAAADKERKATELPDFEDSGDE